MWERNFLAAVVPSWPDGYADYVASSTLREAVFEHVLFGDTYFTQFRGLHQIPELLAAEIADTMEATILAIRTPGRRLGGELSDLGERAHLADRGVPPPRWSTT